MVRYGLLGMHSKDITDNSHYKDKALPHDIFWSLLHTFLDQTGFRHRTIIYSSTGQTVLRIEKTNAWPKKINKKYTGPSQTTKMRTVLYSKLGKTALSQEKERNEAVLVWLLLNMGGSSVDIQYPIDIATEDISELSQTIGVFTKENEKGGCVYVEGVALVVDCRNIAFLPPALQLVPALSRLELAITPFYYRSNINVSSLISTISLCKSLKVLKITGQYLDSAVISSLVESLPNIEQLTFWCKVLDATAINSLKKCTRLEILEIHGVYQPSSAVQALVTHLSSLKDLIVKCDTLDPAAVESFKTCKQLERLGIYGRYQPNSAVQALAKHLLFLKELWIACKFLDPAAAESFEACKKLETLVIHGILQETRTVQALLTHLPFLKDLTVECKTLDSTALENIKAHSQLEKLRISGESQPSAVVQALVMHFSSLNELSIKCDALDSTAVESFKACRNLEKLTFHGEFQPSTSFLIGLLEVLLSLQELSIKIDSANLALADALRKCPKLYFLDLTASQYAPGFMAHYLKTPLPKLVHLDLLNFDEQNTYSKEDERAIREARVFFSL
ncbi:hypothetical protein NECID01_1235 [Nematocida sp. AWRm77]|nr:hypothetical protein NECID01_1235 [Nematocida sp. AWRm77]